ncbi:hypothetical protein [Mycobacterium stomatepiae]|uniref:Uncharacterized protein n=1 Tax=Mycobacterium stomatepiae TaxID=470076 RepID=A0A7I7QCS3_9MYCO|nr:hypothetical protein [Mycobacterium stomatepiae]MCV7164992.1 hypothetical protein [Mycobacterium stomatepiae]BBY24134.1 hypothetical protein MSTO_43390 [Mycobacterium stomatepiae]
MNELTHIPVPPEATWVGEWVPYDADSVPHSWVRHFTVRKWTVDTFLQDPAEIELVGAQFPDGSIEMFICLESALYLDAGEGFMMSTTVSRAAEELERTQGGRR